MKKYFVGLLGFLLSSALASQSTYFLETFNRGIPSTFLNEDVDGLAVGNGFKVSVAENWFAREIYGTDGRAAVSTSHHTFELPTENWLVTPAIQVDSDDVWLAWDAKSVHYDLREDYKVLISTKGASFVNFEEVYSVKEENYLWNHHLISLSNYVGKEIQVAFVHTSTNKFLLAIDNLFIGKLEKTDFEINNFTRRFCGDVQTTKVEGVIRNIGRNETISNIICTSGDIELSLGDLNETLKSSDTICYTFDLPTYVGKASKYLIDVELQDGSRVNLLRDSVVCSYYPRTLLLEKSTGVWCTACPGVIPFVNRLKERYKDEIVYIESHSAYNDHVNLSYPLYDAGLKTINYPAIYYNRYLSTPQYSASDFSKLRNALSRPTFAKIDLNASCDGGNLIHVKTDVQFAKDFDNAKDNYRVGFAIVENEIKLDYNIQVNNAAVLDTEEYALLTSPIQSDFMFYHNVARGTESSFLGIPLSLPSSILKGQTYSYEGELTFPNNIINKNNISVIAFVLNYFTDDVMNVDMASLCTETTHVNSIMSGSQEPSFNVDSNKQLQVQSPMDGPSVLRIFDLEGRLIEECKYIDKKITHSLTGLKKGCYILSLQQNNHTYNKKILTWW